MLYPRMIARRSIHETSCQTFARGTTTLCRLSAWKLYLSWLSLLPRRFVTGEGCVFAVAGLPDTSHTVVPRYCLPASLWNRGHYNDHIRERFRPG